MSIKFKSSIESEGKIIQSKHRAIKHTDTVQTLEVKVVTKTAAHPEYQTAGSSNLGYTIDGVEGAYLELTPGITYRFDQSDSSNSGHPLRFYEDAAKTTAYTTGVTNNDSTATPGNANAYTQIIPTTSTPPILFYQCNAHVLMGSYAKFGTGTVGDTYSINASVNTSDSDDVDLNLNADAGSDSAVRLTAGSNISLTRNGAQQVTIAASGGALTVQDEGSALSTAATTLNFTGSGVTASGTGATKTINVTGGGSSGGTVTVEKNVYTANGSTAAFNTSSAIANENNVQVYIDGVYQSKDDYTASGSTITLDANPANGAIVELIHMVAISGVIARDSFTGNGSTTAYVLSMSIANENATQVYIDGVYQSKDNYSTSGSTLTFSTAPTNGTAIEAVHLKAVNATSINQNSFTGNGSNTTFTLSQSISDENKTFVFIQGVYQEKSTYSISGTTLTFSTPPQNGYSIEVMTFGSVTIGGPSISGTDWQSTIQTSNFTAAAGKGYFVDTASGAVTVSLPAGSAGDEIHFTDYSGNFGSNEIIFAQASGQKILGDTDNYKCTTANATVRLIYQNDTKGWTADNIATTALNIDFLVVAGGGGAGNYQWAGTTYYNGGGGGGGFRSSTDGRGGGLASDATLVSAFATNYTVTVGAGGAAGADNAASGSTGADSVFATITSKGGGGGGASSGNGLDGGSGGGAGSHHSNGSSGTGGAALTSPVVHGYRGGNSTGNNSSPGSAGGGGAGGQGVDHTSGQNGTNGGPAKVATITGSNVYYAAGGGGGRGWGGSNGSAGTNARGGANSGDGKTGGGGAGESGAVILRYPNSVTITVGSGLTSTTATVGSNKVTTFTAGTGNVQFN